MKNENQPEIRFPDFKEWWSKSKFEDFISKAGKKNTTDTKYKAYSVSNKVGLVSQADQFDGSRLDDLDKASYKLVNPGEFAYNPSRINVGSIAFNNLNETVIVSSLYVVLKMSEKLDNEFILQYIKSSIFNNEVRRNTEGSVREYLFFESFKNIRFPLPYNKDEQVKIGEFFKQLDETISLYQQELVALKQTKQGFLQKMFPKQGAFEPEIRFPEFTDNWEENELGNMVEFYTGLTYSPENIVTNGTLVLRSSNIQNGEIVEADNVYVSPEVVNSQNVLIGDVIVVVRNGSRDLIGKHASVKKQRDNTVIGAFMTGIRAEVPSFINVLLDSNQFAIEINKNLGATINQITTGNFKKMKFFFPTNEEQEKIGMFFEQLDETISLYQQELEFLKETKKAFQQKMFV